MTLTPKQIADGWKVHEGWPCPVSPISKPGVMFRSRPKRPKPSGVIDADFWRGEQSELDWWHWRGRKQTNNDIIAYKPEPRP